jgi:hypothetical protein
MFPWVRACRLFFAALVLLAIVAQAWQSIVLGGLPAIRFFSYFTIQSNLYAAAVLLWMAAPAAARRPSPRQDLARGAAALYLAVTAGVYAILLADLPEARQAVIPWVNAVLHRILPLVVVADWLVEPPGREIGFRAALAWLGYPLVYLAYILAQGAWSGWYPYPFLNPAQPGGYAAVLARCAGIALAALLLAWLIAVPGSRVRRALRRDGEVVSRSGG